MTTPATCPHRDHFEFSSRSEANPSASLCRLLMLYILTVTNRITSWKLHSKVCLTRGTEQHDANRRTPGLACSYHRINHQRFEGPPGVFLDYDSALSSCNRPATRYHGAHEIWGKSARCDESGYLCYANWNVVSSGGPRY